MKILELPPLIKHLEAFSVFADKRFKKISENHYKIFSSGNTKIYNVLIEKIKEKEFLVYSNDNGTILKGYIGYPILVTLIEKGVIKLPAQYEILKGIKWRELNEKYKNYKKVLEIIRNNIGIKIFDEILAVANQNNQSLKNFKFYLKI